MLIKKLVLKKNSKRFRKHMMYYRMIIKKQLMIVMVTQLLIRMPVALAVPEALAAALVLKMLI